MIVKLQNWIHQMEEGAGARILKGLLAILAYFALMLMFNVREFHNFDSQEAMEQAQLARNIARGKGFVTDVIRPLDLYVLKEHQKADKVTVTLPQPDLANAPAYPWLLAQWMKAGRWTYEIEDAGHFDRYQPDQQIAYLNQILFLLVLLLLFQLAKRLFDGGVAWMTVLVLGSADLFWRFTQSGLPNLLAALLLLITVWCLTRAEQGVREGGWNLLKSLPLVLMAGAFLALTGLTRYSLLLLIFPVIVYVFMAFEQKRVILLIALLTGFCGVLAPWVMRNMEVCGKPFGTASYAVYADTAFFPEDHLERALKPVDVNVASDLGKYGVEAHWDKFFKNIGQTLTNDLPKLGGTWASAFFLACMLFPFTRPALIKLRLWVGGSLILLAVAQTLGRTYISTLSPEVNGENLLMIMAPLVVMFGVGMFSILVEQLKPSFDPGHGVIVGTFLFIFALPLIVNLMNPRYGASAYPPYRVPIIQQAARWLKADEWMVSDMPAAVAWYGQRSSLLIPRDYDTEFKEINQARPFNALYLTTISMDRKLLTEMSGPLAEPWSKFALSTVIKQELPDGFPLKHAYADWFPYQLYLADKERW